MAQCIKHLLWKHEDLGLNPSTHVKARCGSVTCKSITVGIEKSWGQVLLRGLLTSLSRKKC